MLPRKLHIEQIERFHDQVQRLSDKIDSEPDVAKKANLCIHYFHLTSALWKTLDDAVEKVKDELDNTDELLNYPTP